MPGVFAMQGWGQDEIMSARVSWKWLSIQVYSNSKRLSHFVNTQSYKMFGAHPRGRCNHLSGLLVVLLTNPGLCFCDSWQHGAHHLVTRDLCHHAPCAMPASSPPQQQCLDNLETIPHYHTPRSQTTNGFLIVSSCFQYHHHSDYHGCWSVGQKIMKIQELVNISILSVATFQANHRNHKESIWPEPWPSVQSLSFPSFSTENASLLGEEQSTLW